MIAYFGITKIYIYILISKYFIHNLVWHHSIITNKNLKHNQNPIFIRDELEMRSLRHIRKCMICTRKISGIDWNSVYRIAAV